MQAILDEKEEYPSQNDNSHQDEHWEAVQERDDDQPGEHPEEEQWHKGKDSKPGMGLHLDGLKSPDGPSDDCQDWNDWWNDSKPGQVHFESVRVYEEHRLIPWIKSYDFL